MDNQQNTPQDDPPNSKPEPAESEERKKFMQSVADEAALAMEIVRMGNIYYQFEWLDKGRKLINFVPDGLAKSVLMPLRDGDFTRYTEFTLGIIGKFPTLCGITPFPFDKIPDARLIYLNNVYGIISEKPLPMVRVFVFLKHLKGFIAEAVANGFIAPAGHGQIKEYRTVICDPDNTYGKLMYSGVHDRGFAHFCLDTGRLPGKKKA